MRWRTSISEPMFQSHYVGWFGRFQDENRHRRTVARLVRRPRTILKSKSARSAAKRTVIAEINEKLYSTPTDGVKVAQRLGLGERTVHGRVHVRQRSRQPKPGVVKLRPELLGDISARRLGRGGRAYRIRRWKPSISPTASRLSWCSTAVWALARKRSPRRCGTWRRQDEHRYGHAVRVHPCDRRSCVLKRRCRACVDGEVGEEAVRSGGPGARRPRARLSTRVVEACKVRSAAKP